MHPSDKILAMPMQGIEARVSMCLTARQPPDADKLWVTGVRRAAVYSRPFRQHQKTILEIVSAVFALFLTEGMLVTLPNCCCELGLCL